MAIDRHQLQRLSRQLPFLPRLEEELKGQLLEQASLIRLKKGQSVCQEGNHCTQLAVLCSGSARVYKLGENGKEITLYRLAAGESCVLTASCILSHLPFPAFAICEADLEAVALPATTVHRWLSTSPIWRDYIFGLVATRLSNIINVVEDVAFRRMDKRIAHYLCHHPTDSDQLLRVTHQEIASELGTSREVVSRILKEFEHESMIRVTRGAIALIDLPKLNQKAAEP